MSFHEPMGFKCIAPSCSNSDKIFATLFNFERHLKNKHPTENMDKLLDRSRDSYDQEQPGDPTKSRARRETLQGQDRTVLERDKKTGVKQYKSDSGYLSCPDTSAPSSISSLSLVHQWVQREKLEERYHEPQGRFPYSWHETEDTLASPQNESYYSFSRFGKTPYKIQSSTSGSDTSAASQRILENRHGQQSPQPLVSSDGELSFMGLMDSDELAVDWEANLEQGLRLLRSKLITELIDTYTHADCGDENMQCQPYTAATTSDSSPGSWQDSSSNTYLGTSNKLSKATSCGKHQQSSGEGVDEDEDTREGPRRKRPRVTKTSISLDGRLLACPYSKFDPMRYSEQNLSEKKYRGCSSIYLTTISRLKQHLYRVHKRPDNYCLSCFDEFKSEKLLSAHNRARPSCEVQDPRFEERMTTEQVNLIKRRSVGKTLEETWFAIFKILFPGTPLPTTPFVDSVSPEAIQGFLDHFFRQARPRLSHLVQCHLGGRLLLEGDQQRILDSALESAIAQLVRETDPRQENDSTPEEVSVEEVQPHDMEDHAIDAASQAPLPRVTQPTSPVGGGNVLEESYEDTSQSWATGYFDAAFFEDAFQ